MTFLPATEFGSKEPPPNVGRASRRSSGLVSVPVVVVGGRVLVVGAAVVGVVVGRVVGGTVVVVGFAVVEGWFVVAAVEPVVAVDAVVDDAPEPAADLAPSTSTVTTRAWAPPPSGAVPSAAVATVVGVVGVLETRVSTAAESGLVQEVMASPIASTAKGGLERIRTP